MRWLLLLAVFVVATCGLMYELVAGTLASYLLGDSVTQFSTIIGVYLFAMGVGSYLSRFINTHLLDKFVIVEILVGVVGGFSSSILFLLFDQVASFQVLLYLLVLLTGMFVGLEIPLLMRILEGKVAFKELVSQIFTFDYIGALAASIIFPLLLVPRLGLIRTSLFFGLANLAVALILIWKFNADLHRPRFLKWSGILASVALTLGFIFANRLTAIAEQQYFREPIIFAKSTPYQRLVLTKRKSHLKLYINGNLQFNSKDEYRYHEALVHPAAVRCGKLENVLVLGGGDGLAVRELLKYEDIEQIKLVDLDPEMTRLFRQNEILGELNQGSLVSPKLEIINTDAFLWVKEEEEKYDLVIIDFPDPSNFSLGKLYSRTFYSALASILSPKGVVVVQSTSPYAARKAFWCINSTLESVGLKTVPYHVYLPSFGDWGYSLGGFDLPAYPLRDLPSGLRFMNELNMETMSYFPKDIAKVETEINRLNNQSLVRYFENEWRQFGF